MKPFRPLQSAASVFVETPSGHDSALRQSKDDWTQGGTPGAVPTGEHLEYLSRTAMEFVRLPRQDDLYHLIASRLQTLLGDAIVVVTSYNPETRELCQRAIVGAGKVIETVSSMAGTQILGYRRVLNVEAERQIKTGCLMKVPEGIYEALLRAVPKRVTQAIEKLLGVRAVYGMGCLVNDECFGGVLMLLRSDNLRPPAEVVEAFISQAALAMQKRHAEDALCWSEERFRTLMENAPDAYLVLTTDGVIRDVNPKACKAVGRSRAEVIGMPITGFLDSNELAGKPLQWNRLKRGETVSETRLIKRDDGRYTIFEAHATPLSDGHVMVIARDITDRRRLEKEVANASRREREAIGRDLHDSLGQQLSGLSYLCAALSQQLASKGAPEAQDANRIAQLLGESASQTRQIAQGLCLVNLTSCGLFQALYNLAEYASSVFGVNCRFLADGEDSIPRSATASNLYLIAQEATRNAVRHGQARRVDIELQTCLERGILLIRDDGHGFPTPPPPDPGMGLRIMQYRAEIIDGLLEVNSTPTGTTVKCVFPLS
jgi:PAS domain S-box-containing protein